MYLIGPLLFWAWAEMTAGFFILCVPCVPKLLAESRLSNRVKVALGLGRSSNATPAASGNDGLVTIGGSGGPSKTNKLSSSQSGRDAENVYYNLGDDDMPMSEYGRSDSQETLNKERGNPVMSGVAR